MSDKGAMAMSDEWKILNVQPLTQANFDRFASALARDVSSDEAAMGLVCWTNRAMGEALAGIAAERTAREQAERQATAALEALAHLVDAQNGPPLLGGSAERFWTEAMEKARAILEK